MEYTVCSQMSETRQFGKLYTVSQQTVQSYFCQNFAKFPPITKIFDTKIAKRASFSEVFSFPPHLFSVLGSNKLHVTKLL